MAVENSEVAQEVVNDSPGARMCRFAPLPAAFFVVFLIPPLVTRDYDRFFKHLGIVAALTVAYVLACCYFGKAHDNPRYLRNDPSSARHQSVFKSTKAVVAPTEPGSSNYQSLAALGSNGAPLSP